MTTYYTIQGDTIDLICWRFYGRVDVLADVLEVNPDLSTQPPHLPSGTLVNLPDLSPPPPDAQIQLWD